jgi:hypothetical protein
VPKPIANTLSLLHGGVFLDECAECLAGVVKAVDQTGKAGKVTITLDLKKAGGTVQVVAKVTDKTPEAPPEADTFWPTVEGNLSLQNPNQQSLDLRDASQPARRVVEG